MCHPLQAAKLACLEGMRWSDETAAPLGAADRAVRRQGDAAHDDADGHRAAEAKAHDADHAPADVGAVPRRRRETSDDLFDAANQQDDDVEPDAAHDSSDDEQGAHDLGE